MNTIITDLSGLQGQLLTQHSFVQLMTYFELTQDISLKALVEAANISDVVPQNKKYYQIDADDQLIIALNKLTWFTSKRNSNSKVNPNQLEVLLNGSIDKLDFVERSKSLTKNLKRLLTKLNIHDTNHIPTQLIEPIRFALTENNNHHNSTLLDEFEMDRFDQMNTVIEYLNFLDSSPLVVFPWTRSDQEEGIFILFNKLIPLYKDLDQHAQSTMRDLLLQQSKKEKAARISFAITTDILKNLSPFLSTVIRQNTYAVSDHLLQIYSQAANQSGMLLYHALQQTHPELFIQDSDNLPESNNIAIPSLHQVLKDSDDDSDLLLYIAALQLEFNTWFNTAIKSIKFNSSSTYFWDNIDNQLTVISKKKHAAWVTEQKLYHQSHPQVLKDLPKAPQKLLDKLHHSDQ